MGKNTRPLPPPLAGKQGRGGATPAAPEAGGLGFDGASGGGEKREEEVGGSIPLPSSSWAGAGRWGDESGRRWPRRL